MRLLRHSVIVLKHNIYCVLAAKGCIETITQIHTYTQEHISNKIQEAQLVLG